MQRKICPICDHVMKHGHYCSFCEQWVSRPNIINASYYLNERHPANETGCEYHTPSVRPNPSARQTIPAAGSSASRPKQNMPGNRPGNPMTAAEIRKQNKSRTGAVVSVVVIIIVMWILITGILPVLFFFL